MSSDKPEYYYNIMPRIGVTCDNVVECDTVRQLITRITQLLM